MGRIFKITAALVVGSGIAHVAYSHLYNPRYPVEGKLALVTGASSGIGKCTAELLAAKGAKVVLVALPDGTLPKVTESIRLTGGNACYYEADCTDSAMMKKICATIEQQHGVPDIIINSAGMGAWSSVFETTPEQVVKFMGAPYFAAAFVVLAYAKQMATRKSGLIVNINSPVSYIAWPSCLAYHATRGAFRAFTQALQMDFKGTGVKAVEVLRSAVKSNYYVANKVDMNAQLPGVAMALIPVLTTEEAACAVMEAVETQKSVACPWQLSVALLQYRLLPCFTDYMMWLTSTRGKYPWAS